ncbi:hypothetical protein [Chlamydia vaughanii]|uniref:hypothetical protein n=1 Tax=Chlamydia vaughanii TaxID=3112552 RepID=UPI0032B2F756
MIYFLDDLLATLANYCKSYFSKEEQNRLLALLIEDLNQYKESLEATSIENSQESSGL